MLTRQLRLAVGVVGLAASAYLTAAGCATHHTSEPQSPAQVSVQALRARTVYSTQAEADAARGTRADVVEETVLSALPGLEGDGRLAELGSWAAAERAKQGVPPSTLEVDRASRDLGIVAPFPLLLFVNMDASGWERDLTQVLAKQPRGASRGRVGVYAVGDQAVVVLASNVVQLEPVPRRIERDQSLTLRAQLADEWSDAQWVVTAPDGTMHRVDGLTPDSLTELQLGTHQIELLARGPQGLEVVANFPVGVGEDPKLEDALADLDEAPTAEAFLATANRIRARAGLGPLTRDAKLDALASAHTRDMNQHHYFAHNSPTEGSTHERMRAAGFPYARYGENIGRARSSSEIHTLWMRSPGHRANLLDPSFTHIGLGVESDGSTQPPVIIATQVFGGS